MLVLACLRYISTSLVQFEDFRTEYASKLLERYRYQHLCFNDDIQVSFCPRL